MSVYVKDGTPLEGPLLCDSCSYGHVQKGYRMSEHQAMCTLPWPAVKIPFRVRECSSYLDTNRENLCEMKKVAWTIQPERGKNTAGFFQPPGKQDEDDEFEFVLNKKKE
jgi:hypothetical protein